jgi:hypothetical protein
VIGHALALGIVSELGMRSVADRAADDDGARVATPLSAASHGPGFDGRSELNYAVCPGARVSGRPRCVVSRSRQWSGVAVPEKSRSSLRISLRRR